MTDVQHSLLTGNDFAGWPFEPVWSCWETSRREISTGGVV
eukprot:COSAG02_NODE_38503_length_428_cov_0.933131_1_plen_39_part_01